MSIMEIWTIDRLQGDFTQVYNAPFRKSGLSLKARGFLVTLLVLPEDWDFSIAGMCAVLQEGESAIRATIKELLNKGYCKVTREIDPVTKRVECYHYAFSEYPKWDKKPLCDFPQVENPQVENPQVENQRQYNITIRNTINNKIHKEEIIPPYNSPTFVEIWDMLLRQPKWRKKSEDALRMSAEELGKVTEEVAIQMMRNTIKNGWQGLFPIDKATKQVTRKPKYNNPTDAMLDTLRQMQQPQVPNIDEQ